VSPLLPLLPDERIVLDADVHDRDELFRMAADRLAVSTGLHGVDVYRALSDREKLGSTAMGHAIAIPHARMRQVSRPMGLYVRTRTPLAFGAHDGKPVSQFLFLLVPAEANEQHLKLMAAAAELLSDPAVRRDLGNCARCEDVRNTVAAWDDARPAARNE
jgi:PTS system nitrogen regulatory IIA component